jgi:glycosyltransferase involved in cell wall biosynthesis
MFQYLLGRQPNQNELYSFLENYRNGSLTRSSTLEEIIKSSEFKNPEDSEDILLPELNNQEFVEYLYQVFLKRTAEPEALEGNCTALENGVSRITLLHTFLKSEEFISLENQTLVEEISDHQFLHTMWQILLDGPCDAHSEKHYLNRLEFGLSRLSLVSEIMKTDTFKNRIKRFSSLERNQLALTPGGSSQNSAMVLGTGQFINQEQWNNILLDVLLDRNSLKNSIDDLSSDARQSSTEKAKTQNLPIASIITSLYKGKDYINCFMENIASQTIFRECELIIIDANSPEGEYEIIQKYMELFDNIKYIRLDEVIGIYDAWNLGIQQSKGQFLTNANLDDLRRSDCLEKQVMSLKKHEDIDIVYQDFYYTFTPNLPFEIIAKCGVQSKLPILTKANMLQFNSPHNAPMWRKSLHDKIGLFNTRYKSAGDYEFWLRALLHGSQFLKIEEPLVAYYNNPFGISTRSEGAATNEVIEIQGLYLKLFGHSFFSMPKEDFIDFCCTSLKLTDELMNVPSLEKWQGKDVFLYQCFEQKLKKIASSKFYLSLAD